GPRATPGRRACADANPGSPRRTQRKEDTMDDGTTDDVKGRIKEAGGDLTGDDSLKNEGKVDQAAGSVKDKVGDAADKVKDGLRKDGPRRCPRAGAGGGRR